jgi:hypothetical protein
MSFLVFHIAPTSRLHEQKEATSTFLPQQTVKNIVAKHRSKARLVFLSEKTKGSLQWDIGT